MFTQGTLPVLSEAAVIKTANAWLNSKERKALRAKQAKLERMIRIKNVGSFSQMERDRGEDL